MATHPAVHPCLW